MCDKVAPYSIFTGMCAGVVAGMVDRGELDKAKAHYKTLLNMPTIHKAQLDRTIVELTNKDVSWLFT